MTPLDDELRRTLSARAATVAPAADPLSGIESRAHRIRRRRTAVAVAGAVAGVAAVALVVPGLVPDRTTRVQPGATPSATLTTGGASLDPQHPWAFRGTALDAGTDSRFRSAWGARYPDSASLTVLWSQVYEPSAEAEAVVLGGSDLVGFLHDTRAGAQVVSGVPLPAGTAALQFALPGDEAPRLVVVAAPDTTIGYAPDGTTFREVGGNGVAQVALEGDQAHDRVRITTASGDVVYDEPAADPAPADRPDNAVSWGLRGKDAYSPSTLDLRRRFVQALDRTDPDEAEYNPLFVDRVDGVSFTMGQAWLKGSSTAYAVSYAVGPDNVPQFFVGPATPRNPSLLAFLVSEIPGHDLLVVVPQPGTGQVLYDDNASGSFRAAEMPSDLDGVALVERDLQASTDRLELLDGNGDLDHPVFEGSVTPLLCGLKECG